MSGELLSESDIKAHIDAYRANHEATARYASFDYCFNHFQSHREAGRLEALADGSGLELSCLHLGFYLASWGMLRGSTALLQRSMKVFEPVIEALVAAPTEIWDLDANRYTDETCSALLNFAGVLRAVVPRRSSDILVTKILLGTMGNVPAYDTNFKNGFQAWTFSINSLRRIGRFYDLHAEIIDGHRKPTLDFATGRETNRKYTRAKVIDMIFFIEGAR